MLKKPTLTTTEIDKKELIKLLEKIRPDLDLSKRENFINVADSFFFSVILGSSRSVAEIVGRLENIKYNAQKFIYSKDFDIYLNKLEEHIIKDNIKKSEAQAS
jgi:hypothetical protein